MKKRTLGKNGPVVSAIGLDVWECRNSTVKEMTVIDRCDSCRNRSRRNVFDTADMYGVGHNGRTAWESY